MDKKDATIKAYNTNYWDTLSQDNIRTLGNIDISNEYNPTYTSQTYDVSMIHSAMYSDLFSQDGNDIAVSKDVGIALSEMLNDL